MRYKRLEDLPVWNSAIELAVAVFALASKPELTAQWTERSDRTRGSLSLKQHRRRLRAWHQQRAPDVSLHFARLSW